MRVKIEPRTLQGPNPTNSSSSMTFTSMIEVQFGNFVVWLQGLPGATGTGEYLLCANLNLRMTVVKFSFPRCASPGSTLHQLF